MKKVKKFIILPDITCDLSEQIRDFFGLEDYIRGHVHINEESLATTLDCPLEQQTTARNQSSAGCWRGSQASDTATG